MELTGQQYEALQQALLSAYDRATLRRMLRFELDKRLDRISLAANLEEMVFEVIDAAGREGWTARLVAAAYDANPGNPRLSAFASEFLAFSEPRPVLERMIRESNSYLDIDQWRERLGQIEGQVCSLEVAGAHVGTAFLVGPDLALTNYHVVASLLPDSGSFAGRQPDQVTLRFDFKRSADGHVVHDGRRYRLAVEWLVDASPYSPVDLQAPPKRDLPDPEHLDYALLRVEGAPGEEARRGAPGGVRGWISLPAAVRLWSPHTPLFIVQHPMGVPLKLALDTDAILGLNGNGTRVTYTTNTEPGSSGSPCFDSQWALVALHHSGDPRGPLPSYNEGVPIDRIRARIERQAPGALA